MGSATANVDAAPQERWRITTDDLPRKYRNIFWSVAALLGLLQAWEGRFAVFGDGISYLEMGEAYARGDWKMAISSYWSPIYAWLITIPLRMLKVSRYWESTVVHVTNFIIYIFVLCSFEFFLTGLIHESHGPRYPTSAGNATGGQLASLPGWSLRLLGYALFVYASLSWLSPEVVSPDLCVEGIVFLVAGTMIRIYASGATARNCAILGLLLGIGYLTKLVFFPLAFVFFAMSFFAAGNPRKSAPRILLGFVIFLMIAVPYIAVLSKAKGHLTYGDTGKIAYASYVDSLPLSVHWQGADGRSGTPAHPTRKVLDNPPVYEFAQPVGGSYPAWYEPPYWWEGVRPYFDARREVGIIHQNLHFYWSLLAAQGEFIVAFFALALLAPHGHALARRFVQYAFLWVPALVAVGSYAAIYVESRYLPGFLIILWLCLLRSIVITASELYHKLVWCITLAVVMTVGARTLRTFVIDAGHATHPANTHWQIAEQLRRDGVRPGDRVASIGFTFDGYWAHLADVKIVAEVTQGDAGTFWLSEPATKARVLQTFTNLGAKAVVCNRVPQFSSPPGWQHVGQSEFFVLPLSPTAPSVAPASRSLSSGP